MYNQNGNGNGQYPPQGGYQQQNRGGYQGPPRQNTGVFTNVRTYNYKRDDQKSEAKHSFSFEPADALKIADYLMKAASAGNITKLVFTIGDENKAWSQAKQRFYTKRNALVDILIPRSGAPQNGGYQQGLPQYQTQGQGGYQAPPQRTYVPANQGLPPAPQGPPPQQATQYPPQGYQQPSAAAQAARIHQSIAGQQTNGAHLAQQAQTNQGQSTEASSYDPNNPEIPF